MLSFMLLALMALATRSAVAVGNGDAQSALDAGKNFASDINNLDFANIIGGPMSAVIDAQITAAQTTINFINQVGFFNNSNGEKEVVLMQFNYRQSLNNGTEFQRSMEIPFLYLVPIPYIVFTELNINFNMKLNAISNVNQGNTLAAQGALATDMDFGVVAVGLSGSVAYQQSTSTGVHVERTYGMKIDVKAVQAETTPGLEHVLRLFETIVQSDLPLRS